MNAKKLLRLISLVMLIIATIFIAFALSHPEMGTVFYIGKIRIGAEIWRAFYLIYLIIMSALFITSFFIKKQSDK